MTLAPYNRMFVLRLAFNTLTSGVVTTGSIDITYLRRWMVTEGERNDEMERTSTRRVARQWAETTKDERNRRDGVGKGRAGRQCCLKVTSSSNRLNPQYA
ncbi:hypothetical protein BDN71DRAFT_1453626 [Pleurotus eryngii]|uniref:Uncharacterized protein n=1 Tax=Pleurotus eryngii TaxID=5323 RepID=A0A9P5ZPU8_PLEER|nr:hypothetical protein BDN71DRAFT_1453626 [Pleurotus eryngii]